MHGATSSARAWILSRWVTARPTGSGPIVVVCPSDDSALELLNDLETLSSQFIGQTLRVAHLPTWEQSPYSSIAPSIRTRLTRVATLSSLASEELPDVLVTTLAGSLQATLPAAALRECTISLSSGQEVESREALSRRLLEGGYHRVETVEDPGTFSVRGDIIDVFPPERDQPIRIELFGDEVDKIREFDPASQRSLPDPVSGAISIGPAREALINLQTAELTRSRVKHSADDRGIHRSTRDPILSSIQEGVYPDHSDTWAPFCFESFSNLWGHCSGKWPIVWDDELASQQAWDDHWTKLRESFEKSEVIAPPPDQLFRLDPATEARLRSAKLYLDRLIVAPKSNPAETLSEQDLAGGGAEITESRPGPVQKVSSKANTDLAAAARSDFGFICGKIIEWRDRGVRIALTASTRSQAERIRFLLEERRISCSFSDAGLPNEGQVAIYVAQLSAGFRWGKERLVVLTENELLGTKPKTSGARRKRQKSPNESTSSTWSGLQALADLEPGDAVVHIDHGIGRYLGLVRLDHQGAPSDFLHLEYAAKDRLYIPVYRLNVIQKYVGSGEGVTLDRLGSQSFAKAKERVKDAVRKLAIDLVQLYAERKVRPGIPFSGRDAAFREFESAFAFEETPDQLKAIDDTLSDMESGRVMDRLVCGDVGYGKTEVAIRAAFRAITDGKQVVLLVPTTVLAHQHEQSFKARLKDYPIRIESVSRFKTPKEQRQIIADVGAGKVDLVIGTHRLLSKDVRFRDLGLVIVDEEHRFGVEHKEKLKTLKVNTHVLTLTATPIPRTLHMALSGLREISLINTPPVDRLPIRTYVSRFDDELIKRAIEVELNRGGQVFFVHNRIQSIHELANRVRQLVPQATIAIGHGQMSETELEKAMVDFYQKRANVLVCTSIVESGLDIPSANTILINRADAFGLAQLYQIRGRVGRGQARAYAYLLLPAEGGISEDARKRLEVIQKFVELGSGFSVASHDLEIRGGGDLLGPQQSGHIAAVGFDLYTELLDEAVRDIEGRSPSEASSRKEPEIKAPFAAFLPDTYVPDVHQRLSLYRRLSASGLESELLSLESELADRFGRLPEEAQNLLWLIRIKQQLKRQGIDALTVGPQKISLSAGSPGAIDPARAIARMAAQPDRFQITPDSKLVVSIAVGSLRDLSFALESLFKDLSPRNAS